MPPLWLNVDEHPYSCPIMGVSFICLEPIFTSLSQGRETQRALSATSHPQGPAVPRAPAARSRGDTRSGPRAAPVPCTGPALLRGFAPTPSATEQYHRRAHRQGMLCAGPPCLGKFLLSGHEKTGYNTSPRYRALLGAGHQHVGFACCSGIQELFSQYIIAVFITTLAGLALKQVVLSLPGTRDTEILTNLPAVTQGDTAGLETRDKDFEVLATKH